MLRRILAIASVVIVALQPALCPRSASAANVMNYGAGGNDYYRFTVPSMAFVKASGFTTLIPFAMHVNPDGTLVIGGDVACTNGVYTGPADWASLIAAVKTPPTTVNRYEVCIGGWTDNSYDNIKSLVASQGTGVGSILYRNFQALKNAVPGIDAINDDQEQSYDLNSTSKFANMLGSLGFKYTLAPYTRQSFWVNLKNSITNCDYIYLQCYAGGAGNLNQVSQWNSAFGNGVKVIPGLDSNGADPAQFRNWYLQTGAQGGFYYPYVVFNSTYWSAIISQANGTVPAMPTGLTAVPGGQQVSLSWNVVPGAISYNIKRSTSSGAETNLASVSTTIPWPGSNNYFDTGLASGTTYYYKISAVNINGESSNSPEVSAVPQPATVFGFETPSIGHGSYQYNPPGGSWAFNGSSPNGSGIIANASAFGNPNAPEGLQAAFVQHFGSVSQSLSGFVPGTNYTITFSAAERGGNTQSWNVKINNTVIGSYNPGSSAASYTDYNASFTATATTNTLSFVGTDLGVDNTIFIDNVRISPPLLPVPVVAKNPLPATAVDVVGGQVTFVAAINGTNLVYQWQKIRGGVTNNIVGATNTMLTLTNLQASDAASYRLRATNAYGATVSAPGVLTVNGVPGAVNNVITKLASQTGLGGASPNFVPTWTVASGSLIAGQPPRIVGLGNFSTWGGGVVAVLTDGTFGSLNLGGAGSLTQVMCGNVAGGAGQSVTYALTNSAKGYDLTNITIYGGWGDAGRDQQSYTVYYSKASAPSTFTKLASVSYNPANSSGVQSATRATLIPLSGFLATNVVALKIDFTMPSPENDSCGYSEIQIFGFPSVIPPATNPTNIICQVVDSKLSLNWPADHIGWRLQTQTNSLAQGLGTNWADIPGSTATNRVFLPINPDGSCVFYRLTYP